MKVLIVVDLQKGFRPPVKVVSGIKKILPRYEKVIFTRFVNRPKSFFRTELKIFGYARGSSEGEFVLLAPENTLILEKPGYGLTKRQIDRLKKYGIREADISGVDTDACVLGVAYSLWDNGIKPKVLINLCSSGNGLHKEAVKILRKNVLTKIS